jgi:hypothetical protein
MNFSSPHPNTRSGECNEKNDVRRQREMCSKFQPATSRSVREVDQQMSADKDVFQRFSATSGSVREVDWQVQINLSTRCPMDWVCSKNAY